MSTGFDDRKEKIVLNLSKYGIFGQIIGFIASLISGGLGGGLGSLFASLFAAAISSGIFGSPEPDILRLVIGGMWIYFLWGILPGIVIGIGFSIFRNGWSMIITFVLALILGVVIEFGINSQINIFSFFLYYTLPFSAPITAIFIVVEVRTRLGFYPLNK